MILDQFVCTTESVNKPVTIFPSTIKYHHFKFIQKEAQFHLHLCVKWTGNMKDSVMKNQCVMSCLIFKRMLLFTLNSSANWYHIRMIRVPTIHRCNEISLVISSDHMNLFNYWSKFWTDVNQPTVQRFNQEICSISTHIMVSKQMITAFGTLKIDKATKELNN